MDKYKELTSQGKEKFIEKIKTLNLYENNSERLNEIIDSIQKIQDNLYLVYSLSQLEFDGEGFESSQDYKNLLDGINNILGDYKLEISVKNKNSEVFIKLGGKNKYTYEIDIIETQGWISENFIDYINNTLKEENFEKQFYALPPYDQTVAFVFLTEEIYSKAIDLGIIPAEMGYFFEDM